MSKSPTSSWAKYSSLLFLVLETSSIALILRQTRLRATEDGLYISGTAVLMTEIIKLVVSIVMLYTSSNLTLKNVIQDENFGLMILPAALYTLQNNLIYLASSNLDTITFQIILETKILTTAVFSYFLLGKQLAKSQILSLVLLVSGVVAVETANVTDTTAKVSQNRILGVIALMCCSTSSGFASCYFERVVKGKDVNVWVKNIQLSIASSGFAYLGILFHSDSYALISNKGFFTGYTGLVWVVVFGKALGGILVALALKYADSILKTVNFIILIQFATSSSIILTSMISIVTLGVVPTPQLVLGILCVITAITIYVGKEKVVKKRKESTV